MATTKLLYNNVSATQYQALLVEIQKEFHVTYDPTNNTFDGNLAGGFIKAHGKYDPAAQKVWLAVEHPRFIINDAKIKASCDSWFAAALAAPAPSATK